MKISSGDFMNRAYRKDVMRSLRGGWRRFLAIALITALGVMMFSGLQAACQDLRREADSFFDAQNLHDLEIKSTLGLTEDDAAALAELPDVEQAECVFSTDVTVVTEAGGALELSAVTMTPGGTDALYPVTGRLPEREDECALTEAVASKYGLQTGSILTLTAEEGSGDILPDTFTVTALVIDPTSVGSTNGAVSYRNSDTEKDCLYIPSSAVDTKMYTSVLVRMTDSDSYFTYDTKYSSAVSTLASQIRDQVQDAREESRLKDVQDEAYAKLDSELSGAQEELDDGRQQLSDAKDEAEQQFEQAQEAIDSGLKTLNSRKAELDAREKQLEDSASQIESGRQQLREQEESLEQKRQELTDQQDSLMQKKRELQTQRDTLAAGQANAGVAQLEEGIRQTDAGLSQIAAGLKQVEDGRQQLANNLAQLDAAQKEADSGRQQLADGRQQLAQAGQQLADNQSQLDAQKTSAEETFAEKEQAIADAQAQLDERKAAAEADIAAMEKPSWYIQSRRALGGYSDVSSDADSIDSIGTVFPMLFLAVAVLISLTAITRMVEEDRGLLGTYRALGFTEGEIRSKYLIFALLSAACGSAAGTLGAMVVLPGFLFWVFSNMYLFPQYRYAFLVPRGILGPALFIGAVLIAAWAACAKELSEAPAQLMRPKAPPAGRRIILEYIQFIWKRLSFLSKVTARNLFRYGRRFLMTVVGIAGCMVLLLFGFAVKDSVTDMLPGQYGGIFTYDCLAVASQADDTLSRLTQEAAERGQIDDSMSLYTTTLTLEDDSGDQISAQLYVLPDGSSPDGFMDLRGVDGEKITLKDGDVWVSINAAEILGLHPGEDFLAGSADMPPRQVILTGTLLNYLGNYVYMTGNTYDQYFQDYQANAELLHLTPAVTDQAAWCRNLAGREGIAACVSTQKIRSEFQQSFKLVNMVVYVVIIMSAALAVVVLYTLGTTNISERERELATIRVLGFSDREVSLYINREVMILTAIGILIGLPAGRAAAQMLNRVLRLPGIYLRVSLHLPSYFICVALILIFALLVQSVTDRMLRRIDPVTALKSAE